MDLKDIMEMGIDERLFNLYSLQKLKTDAKYNLFDGIVEELDKFVPVDKEFTFNKWIPTGKSKTEWYQTWQKIVRKMVDKITERTGRQADFIIIPANILPIARFQESYVHISPTTSTFEETNFKIGTLCDIDVYYSTKITDGKFIIGCREQSLSNLFLTTDQYIAGEIIFKDPYNPDKEVYFSDKN